MPGKFIVEPNSNPYAAPNVFVPGQRGGQKQVAGGNAVSRRTQMLRHESAVIAFGWFFIASGILSLLGAVYSTVVVVIAMLGDGSDQLFWISQLVGLVVNLLLGVLFLWTGMGLRRLGNVARICGSVLNIPSVFVGIGILYLWLVWSEKGQQLFTDDYRQIVKATPQIKPVMTITAWVLLSLTALSLLLGITMGILIAVGVIPVEVDGING